MKVIEIEAHRLYGAPLQEGSDGLFTIPNYTAAMMWLNKKFNTPEYTPLKGLLDKVFFENLAIKLV